MNILQRNSPHPAILLNTDSIETDFLLQSSASTTPLMASNQFNLLQQQNSLELKPFKKKEAQIEDDSNTAMNSFKTDITFLDNQSVTSPAANQQQLKLYQQIFKLPNNGIYNKLRYKLPFKFQSQQNQILNKIQFSMFSLKFQNWLFYFSDNGLFKLMMRFSKIRANTYFSFDSLINDFKIKNKMTKLL
ncbi:hypothetical protein BpHYR1_034006 [Brachionus plicatilis]|uniref:Uncharacterized protein n=1 Tax=Brachionus plicatilis TaxID=10195 RepID=A0A3M7Q8V5_BRAPC|nr:hypothetical protein BpHYR1_034006 [Brachionus plicatilis]